MSIELHDVLANDNHAVALYTAAVDRRMARSMPLAQGAGE